VQEQSPGLGREIDPRECIDVIIRRKRLIFTMFLISIIIVAILSLITPRVYEISMIIEPGTIGTNNSGEAIFVDSPANIKAMIEAGTFDLNVNNALKLNSQRTGTKLRIFQPKDSKFLKFSINEPDSKKDTGLRILSQFLNELTIFYKGVIENTKSGIDKKIAVISNEIKNKNDSIELSKESLKIVEAREKELIDELKTTKNNTEQLLIKRNALIENKVQADGLSSLLYSNTIQQNISYFNELNNQLASNRIKKESVVNDIKFLQTNIDDLDIEIEKLKATRENVRSISLVQEPRVSPEPTGPKRRQNVMVAGILGLIVGTFLAFFMEFLEKSRKT
jgi:uncharacterized protein involved in exopolysaccharide biosynthesis